MEESEGELKVTPGKEALRIFEKISRSLEKIEQNRGKETWARHLAIITADHEDAVLSGNTLSLQLLELLDPLAKQATSDPKLKEIYEKTFSEELKAKNFDG